MERNQWIREWTLVGGLFFVSVVPTSVHAQLAPFVKLIIGGLFTSPNQTQTISFDPTYWKTLVDDNNTGSAVYGGVSAGLRIPLTPIWAFEMGAAYYIAADFTQSGGVYQYNSPAFYNMNYAYKIQIQSLMLEGKLLTTYQNIYHPYITAGIGSSFILSRNYHEIPFQPYAVPDPAFANNTKNNLAYSAGLGLDFDLSAQLRLGAGYQYSYFGKAQLGRSPVQMTAQQPGTGNINANQVMVTLTYTI